MNSQNDSLLVFLAIILFSIMSITSCKKEEENEKNNNTPPLVTFSRNYTYGTVDTVFVFDASKCHDKEDHPEKLKVRWDLESDGIWDTEWSVERSISHQYDTTGVHTVTLEVKDSGGLKSSISKDVSVYLPPVAVFTINNYTGNTSSIFEFDASDSYDEGGSGVSIKTRWDFDGDGYWDTSWDYEKTITQQFNYPGNYEIILEIMDGHKMIDTTKRSISVVNVSCDGITEVEYGGKIYETVEIGSQCWFNENLSIDIGTNWVWPDDSSYVEEYGRLYEWNTAKIACPDGWHLPSDLEWCILTSYVDQTVDCDTIGWNGTDAGKKLKSTTGWEENGNGTDAFGFSAKPGGYKSFGLFTGKGSKTGVWSTTRYEVAYAYIRVFDNINDQVSRYYLKDNESAASIRCVKE